MTWFHDALVDLPTADADASSAVAQRAASVLRPAGALRRFDETAVHVAAWQGTVHPRVERPAIVVFAGDHGVVGAGVSAYPGDVTAAMLAAVRAGRATINAIATAVGAHLRVVDVGVGAPTGDIRVEPAMSVERFDEIGAIAADVIDDVVARGADLLVVGELGIGNTTVAAALAAALLGGDPGAWVGRGTGVDDDGLERKIGAVRAATERVGSITDPIETFRQVGGAELVAMAAAVLRARHHRLPVVLDGYVATAAALPLHVARPGALDHCLYGHVSAEPGHRNVLERLGGAALLDLEMRLGEGSGALAAVPLVQVACACVTDVATFDEWFGPPPTGAAP